MDIIDVVPLCHGRCESKSHQTVCHKRSSFAQYEPQGPNTRLSADPRDNLSMIPMVTSHTRRVTFLILLSFISFYIGYINSSKTAKASAVSVPTPSDANDSNEGEAPDFISQIEKCYSYSYFSEACVHDNNEIHRRVQDVLYPKEQGDAHKLEKSLIHRSNRTVHGKLSSEFLSGSASISKREVMSKFDNFGVATFHKSHSSDEEVLLLYNTLDSLPSNTNSRFITQQQSRIPSVNTSEALENCQFLNVQFIHNPSSNSLPMCTVYIPGLNNLPTYHAQRWMRLNGRLQHVGSLTFPSGVNKFDLPKFHPVISKHWEALRTFLENADGVLEEVDSILKKRFEVLNEDDNTVIVMTVNRGDVDLLINFLCAAKSRGLDVRRILVFVADEESKKVIGSLSKSNYDDFGVMVYHDKYNLANVAKGGKNQKYGDSAFTSMMFAKILCVLYPSLLGYNVLYQDADIVWYDNPLGFFRGDHPESSDMLNKYDIIFQHDGSAQPRFSPYSANSGFYFVRSNKNTQYLFISLLYHGDLIRKTTSHQAVLTQLLLEHSSLLGLKVKVMDSVDLFPGGFQYQYDHVYMRRLISGDAHPLIFHMYWTDGKESKVKFLQQFGEWYVQSDCGGGGVIGALDGIKAHCAVKPVVCCHYRDKPSKIPCLDSPLFDKNGVSFW